MKNKQPTPYVGYISSTLLGIKLAPSKDNMNLKPTNATCSTYT